MMRVGRVRYSTVLIPRRICRVRRSNNVGAGNPLLRVGRMERASINPAIDRLTDLLHYYDDIEAPMTLTLDINLPDDLERLRLPPAVAARLQALLDRQDSGHSLTPLE